MGLHLRVTIKSSAERSPSNRTTTSCISSSQSWLQWPWCRTRPLSNRIRHHCKAPCIHSFSHLLNYRQHLISIRKSSSREDKREKNALLRLHEDKDFFIFIFKLKACKNSLQKTPRLKLDATLVLSSLSPFFITVQVYFRSLWEKENWDQIEVHAIFARDFLLPQLSNFHVLHCPIHSRSRKRPSSSISIPFILIKRNIYKKY